MGRLKCKIQINIIQQHIGTILLDLLTYIGSIVTICAVYFEKKDKPYFNVLWDWCILVFIIAMIIVFIFKIIKTLKWSSITVDKNTIFFEYISSEIEKATTVIQNISGDLSWLQKQKDLYKQVKSRGIRIKIYYCKENITDEATKYLISEFEELGIEMIPYPFNIQTYYLKGLFIDTDQENAKFYSFNKIKDTDNIECRHYYKIDIEFSYAKAFVEYVEKSNDYIKHNNSENATKKTMLIGIGGLNNMGKTTLCKNLKQKFGDRIKIIEDTFISTIKESSLEVALYCLLNQIMMFNRMRLTSNSDDIFIFDRTPMDNLAFVDIYKTGNKLDAYIQTLNTEIKAFINTFDLIALLFPEIPKRGASRTIYKGTSVLDTTNRQRLHSTINDLFNNYYDDDKLLKYEIIKYKKQDDFKARIGEIADEISNRIDNIT